MIREYLPNDYDKNLNKHYKVMYMHDGHNLFYKETSAYGGIWDIQSAMNKSEANGNDGVIVVGIDCNSENIEGRLNEYSPWVNNNLKELTPGMGIYKAGGEGKLYGEFLVNSLKPFIDNKYRTLKTKENTFIAGSSMGGFISLYIGYKYPEVFSVIGAFSTAIWFSKENLMKFIKEAKLITKGLEPVLAYMYAKESEIKQVRTIRVGILNNISKEVIRERLRDGYV